MNVASISANLYGLNALNSVNKSANTNPIVSDSLNKNGKINFKGNASILKAMESQALAQKAQISFCGIDNNSPDETNSGRNNVFPHELFEENLEKALADINIAMVDSSPEKFLDKLEGMPDDESRKKVFLKQNEKGSFPAETLVFIHPEKFPDALEKFEISEQRKEVLTQKLTKKDDKGEDDTITLAANIAKCEPKLFLNVLDKLETGEQKKEVLMAQTVEVSAAQILALCYPDELIEAVGKLETFEQKKNVLTVGRADQYTPLQILAKKHPVKCCQLLGTFVSDERLAKLAIDQLLNDGLTPLSICDEALKVF